MGLQHVNLEVLDESNAIGLLEIISSIGIVEIYFLNPSV